MGRECHLAAWDLPGRARRLYGGRTMNPRQRRGLLLMAISGLGLIAVFVLIAGYVADVRAEVDPKVTLLALAKPVEPYQAITDDMVKQVEMPRRWAPPSALRDAGQLVEVGAPRVDGGRGLREQDADPSQVVPVTFALTPEQVLVVSYAETNAAEVRLALLRPGEEDELSSRQRADSREP